MKNKNALKFCRITLKIWRGILSVIFPERCPYCETIIEYGKISCEDCSKGLIRTPLKRQVYGDFPCICAVPYTEPYSKGIKDLKFNAMTQYAPLLAKVLAETVKSEYSVNNFHYITYVPLHSKRKKERGYNQSELLAKELSYLLEIPVIEALKKHKDNSPQHEQTAQKRRENVKGVYKAHNKDLFKNKNLLIIDDIVTTGNTLGECAKTLRDSGAGIISCAAFATVIAKTT